MFLFMNMGSQGVLTAIIFIGAYLTGSVNFSLIAARFLGKGDLRKLGSKNAGVTNLRRVAGWPVAILVLIMDLTRAFAVIYSACTFGPSNFAAAVALPLLLGNLYPVFHGFKGGKGVAASVGIVLALNPLSMLAAGCVFLLLFVTTRLVSLCSLGMALTWPVFFYLFDQAQDAILTIIAITLVIVLTHRSNIVRLIKGNEPKLGNDSSSTKENTQ